MSDIKKMSREFDLRKLVIDKISERIGSHTLSNISEYDAVLLSILTYINTAEDVEPQALIEHYLDFKLSVSAHARKDLIELFKHIVGTPTEQQASGDGEKKTWRII